MATWRILTIDGGGIRGVIAATWLQLLEKELEEHGLTLSGSFDLICGTSTGSIVAAAVATGMDMGTVVSLFKKSGPDIFSNPKGILVNLFKSRYNGNALNNVLQEVLGNSQLEDAKTNLCIPSYDVVTRKTFLLRSYDKYTKDLEIWNACRASCSAPIYFPAHTIVLNDVERVLIDGGVSANNPASLAIAESISINRKKSLKLMSDEIVLISLGTGSSTRNLAPKGNGLRGIMDWALPILDVLFDGSSSVSDHIVSQILDQSRYARIQFDLNGGQGSDDLDDASANNINTLRAAAGAYVTLGAGRPEYEKALRLLIPSKGQEPKLAVPRDDLPSPQ
jgi:hypothetical protein